MNNKLSLGIDTSNYKTSVAVADSGGAILFDSREFLSVKKGDRGLRQSEALFQHIKKLPDALRSALADKDIRSRIGCVAVSSRPRPVEGSYMPVFLAGLSSAQTLSAALDVPLYEFSHQEGHIEAIRFYSGLRDDVRAVCFHFSGGTTEAILLDKGFELIGGSRDISYGQLLDRVGVAMGLDFPCGEELDKMASAAESGGGSLLSKIKVTDGYINLSGIETQALRLVETTDRRLLAGQLFNRISLSIEEMTRQLAEKYGITSFIYAGGVSASRHVREHLLKSIGKDLNPVFGRPQLSADNAVGTALLGGKKIWL